MAEQFCQLLEKEEADCYFESDHREDQRQDRDHKNPIASPRSSRGSHVILDDLVIARIRFEPKRKPIADDRNNADDLVDQNIQRHPGEKDFRHTEARGLDQRESRDQGGAGIANAGHQAHQRIEPKTKFGSGHAQKVIHDEREPFEERLEPLAFSLFFRGQNLPIDFL